MSKRGNHRSSIQPAVSNNSLSSRRTRERLDLQDMFRMSDRHRHVASSSVQRLVTALIAATIAVSAAHQLIAADAEPVTWLTGEKLRSQIERKIGVDWGGSKGIGFRKAMASLARSQQVAILLD